MLPHVNSTVFLITRMHRRKCVGNLPLSLSSPPFLKDAPNSRPGEFWGRTPQSYSIPLVLILPDSTSSNAAAREGQGKYRPQRNTRNQGHCSSSLKSSENSYHAKKQFKIKMPGFSTDSSPLGSSPLGNSRPRCRANVTHLQNVFNASTSYTGTNFSTLKNVLLARSEQCFFNSH